MLKLVCAALAALGLSFTPFALLRAQENEKPMYTLRLHLEKPQLTLLDENGRELKGYTIALPAAEPKPERGFVQRVSWSEPWFPTPNIRKANKRRGITLAAAYPPGHPGNALGGVWIALGLADPNIGLHGTNRPDQIGMRVSAGCYRMHNRDWQEVASLVGAALRAGRRVAVEVGRF